MTSRYLSRASTSWFKGSLGIQVLTCAASSAASIILPSWRSATDTQERNLKLQSLHVLSSPENTSGFPILVYRSPPMVPLAGRSRAGPPLPSVSPAEFLFRSQSSDFVDECLHHICLSLSLGLSLSPLLSCHVHDSRCTTQRQITLTKSTSAPLPCQMKITRMGRSRAQSGCQVSGQADMCDMWMTRGANKTNVTRQGSNLNLSHAARLI